MCDKFPDYKSYDVVLCCPDMDLSLQKEYATPFRLASKEVGKRYRVMGQKGGVVHAVDSPAMQRIVKDKILMLDTMWDFAQIKKAFESGEWIEFFQKLRRLINEFGCVAIVMLVHPTKSGAASASIDAAQFVKDSVTFGGKIDGGFAFSKLEEKPDEPPQIFVQRIKGRGFRGTLTYTIKTHDGETNYLDKGRFPVHLPPGEAGKRGDHVETRGRKPDQQHVEKIDYLMDLEATLLNTNPLEMTGLLNAKFHSQHPMNTIKDWLRKGRAEKKRALSLAQEAMTKIIDAATQKASTLDLRDRDVEFDAVELEKMNK
jgi:hypothetical protein